MAELTMRALPTMMTISSAKAFEHVLGRNDACGNARNKAEDSNDVVTQAAPEHKGHDRDDDRNRIKLGKGHTAPVMKMTA